MAKTVKVLKLISGEEVITRISNGLGDTGSIVCEKPMMTQPVPVQGGQMAMGISPWMFAGKSDEVAIDRSSIIATTDAKKDIEDKYIEMVTGITTSTGPMILKG